MRRKTLRNALRALGDEERCEKAAEGAGIDLSRRGETLSVEEFGSLAEHWDALA
jgi:16S rRNA (adenine1518-N6/adenine1519-N6)-dimethyltransferase